MSAEEITATEPSPVLVFQPPMLKPSLYINRELSWIEFNGRVLEEAFDERNLLLERLKFLTITQSNLDEFFMVRVSGIREQVKSGVVEKSPDGMSPYEELVAMRGRLIPMLEAQAALWREALQPALAAQGIQVLNYTDLNVAQQRAMREYFERMVFPVCTPLAVDPGHPFPHISNLSLNLAVELLDPDGQRRFARVKVPNVLPRLVPVPSDKPEGRHRASAFVWLEQVLAAHLGMLFPEMQLIEVHPFRVIRDADLEIQELEAADLLETIERSLARRRFGSTVALCHNPGLPHDIRTLLADNLELDDNDIYPVSGPLGLSDLYDLTKLDRPDLKDASFIQRVPAVLRGDRDIFSAIQQGDIMLHHPFDSFAPVVDFIRAAATDPNVLAIKQTLYRVGSHSPIVEALLEAAEAGKQVAVLVELKARFDEENNIEWARALEQAGVHVTYGLLGLKTHCKVALVVRKEGEGIRRYVHLGTGNYNPATARGYTDVGLLTVRPEIGADASELFNYLTGYSKQTVYRTLLVAPISLRAGLLARIEREIKRQRKHGDGRLIFKMNGLTDPAFIEALYRASQTGVQADLIVRGMCCLRPGVPGVSENIRVISIVGRFLEHSRLYYFRNGGDEELLMGSADLMPRNLDNRVETLVPVQDDAIRNYLINDVLEAYLRDTAKSRILQADGSYTRRLPPPDAAPVDSQALLLARSTGDNEPVVPLAALPKKYRKHLSIYGRVEPLE